MMSFRDNDAVRQRCSSLRHFIQTDRSKCVCVGVVAVADATAKGREFRRVTERWNVLRRGGNYTAGISAFKRVADTAFPRPWRE